MSSIIKRKTGKQTYLYESISYRNEEGKPRNKKTLIGKIDPETGTVVYKTDYMERMSKAGTPIEQPMTAASFTINAIKTLQ